MSLSGAARLIGIEPSYLSKVERGVVTPRPPMAIRILSFFGFGGDRIPEFFPKMGRAA